MAQTEVKLEMSYRQRIRAGAKPWQFVFWWMGRICFIYGLICTSVWTVVPLDRLPRFSTLLSDPRVMTQVQPNKLLLMMCIYLPLCFLWEIIQCWFPKNSLFRQASSYTQNLIIPFAVATGFCGAFVNFYYTIWWWDDVIHCLGGALAVMLGYEICVALQRKHKSQCPMNILLIASVGMSFIVGSCWELFEFTFDQLSPGMGDTQHWSYRMAEEANQVRPFFNPGGGSPANPLSDYRQRYPLMDTMADMVLNAVGAAVFAIGLRLFPYHHKGARNPNVAFADPDPTAEPADAIDPEVMKSRV
ncbi:MAG: hypothetical protein LBC83_04460 [Oscillospiraceae bacterium]|jgi:fluoride ion exporter CrcB/FEX|nr:hypothetical protein [Oscillospiraceae bacterium]